MLLDFCVKVSLSSLSSSSPSFADQSVGTQMQTPLRCTGKLYSRLVFVEGDQLSLQIQDTPGSIQVRVVSRVCSVC